MAIFSVGGNLGSASGSIFMMTLLTLPGVLNNTLFFCIPAVVLFGLLWLNLPQISSRSATHATTGKKAANTISFPYVQMAILLSFIFLRSSIAAGLTTYIPLYYADYLGGSRLYASYLLSAFLLAGVVGTLVGGILSDRFGRKTVIIGSMILVLPLLSLFQYTSGLVTLGLVVVTGFTFIASFSTTTVLAQEIMPGYEASAASLTIGFSIGMGGGRGHSFRLRCRPFWCDQRFHGYFPNPRSCFSSCVFPSWPLVYTGDWCSSGQLEVG